MTIEGRKTHTYRREIRMQRLHATAAASGAPRDPDIEPKRLSKKIREAKYKNCRQSTREELY